MSSDPSLPKRKRRRGKADFSAFAEIFKQVHKAQKPAVMTCESRREAYTTKLTFESAKASLHESILGMTTSIVSSVVGEVCVGPTTPPQPAEIGEWITRCRLVPLGYETTPNEAWYFIISPAQTALRMTKFNKRLVLPEANPTPLAKAQEQNWLETQDEITPQIQSPGEGDSWGLLRKLLPAQSKEPDKD